MVAGALTSSRYTFIIIKHFVSCSLCAAHQPLPFHLMKIVNLKQLPSCSVEFSVPIDISTYEKKNRNSPIICKSTARLFKFDQPVTYSWVTIYEWIRLHSQLQPEKKIRMCWWTDAKLSLSPWQRRRGACSTRWLLLRLPFISVRPVTKKTLINNRCKLPVRHSVWCGREHASCCVESIFFSGARGLPGRGSRDTSTSHMSSAKVGNKKRTWGSNLIVSARKRIRLAIEGKMSVSIKRPRVGYVDIPTKLFRRRTLFCVSETRHVQQ